MAKPNCIELPGVLPIPILYEDRAVLAIDKPRHWMLVPYSWQRTNRNLQAALPRARGIRGSAQAAPRREAGSAPEATAPETAAAAQTEAADDLRDSELFTTLRELL